MLKSARDTVSPRTAVAGIACGVLLIYGTVPALAAGALVLAATLGPRLLRTRVVA